MTAQGSNREASARAIELVRGWLDSDLLAALRADGSAFSAELPFRLALGRRSILRGTIDLLAGGDVPTIVDYKTDTVPVEGPGHLEEAYELQRALYAAAVAEATGAEAVRSAYVFLQRPGEPLLATIDAGAIAAGRERIEALVERIRSADFTVTPTPHAGLCHDCPARARLCPHPTEMTMRPEP
jgi:RecB family exonuclease